MQRLAGIMLAAVIGAAALAGCALRDPRLDYAYSRASDGLWGDTTFELIDWNFPTSLNQPPIEPPRRIRWERTAIGVTWATKNPLPLEDNLEPIDPPAGMAAKSDDAARSSQAARAGAARTVARDGERRDAR